MDDKKLEHQTDTYEGGLKYSKLVNGVKFPVVRILKVLRKEDKTNIMVRVLLRTLATGLSIPLYPFFKLFGRVRRLMFAVVRSWGADLCSISKTCVETRGSIDFDPTRSYLFASNHASPIDIPVLYKVIPILAGFVANRDLAKIGVIAFWTLHAGGVFVRKNDPASQILTFKSIVRSLEQGNNVVLFPEGVMSRDGELGEFNRGGLFAAASAQAVIVPVYLSGTQDVCKPGDFVLKPGKKVTVIFGEPLDTKQLSQADRKNVHQLIKARIAGLKRVFADSAG